MQDLTPAQRELAELYGVAVEYKDWRGNRTAVASETVLAVLGALGVDSHSPAAAEAALGAHRTSAETQVVPPCIVVMQGQRRAVPYHLQGSGPGDFWIEREDGTRSALAPGSETVTLPDDLPPGYHSLHLSTPDGDAVADLVVTPSFLGTPDRLGHRRGWGFAAQLYSVRSRDSWGVGDLTDLRGLASWSGADLGADFLLLNPLSAAEPVAPMEPSPYLPSSRRFDNPVYLRVEDIAEYADLPPHDRDEVQALRRGVHARLDGADLVDRDTSWRAKTEALRRIHAVPLSPERRAEFRRFLEQEGRPLEDFATWCALVQVHGRDWHGWPVPLQHPETQAVKDFRAEQAAEVAFYSWLQWVLDEQLSAAQSAALASGMALGVVHDLAVGVHPSGADSWMRQDDLARGVTVGAPPDAFNQRGQDWSQPPWRPDRLEALAYAPYRDLIARLLRHAGGIRVDHVIGLFRLWWIPAGMSPDQGTYVRYDHEAMLGILALEGQRAGAVVVGEDLGNVEPAARTYLRKRGILGTSILWWELDDDGEPLPADQWREYSMASVTTHDLPPTAGYLAGDHVDLRESLGLLTRSVEEERKEDEADREAWLARLRHEGLLHEGADTEKTVEALYAYVAATPARLVCIALTDAIGDRRTQNQPGTTDEYPNWRVPLSGPDGAAVLLEDVVASERASALVDTVRRVLRRAGLAPKVRSPNCP